MRSLDTDAMLSFTANLKFDDLPQAVVERASALMVDFMGSVFAGAASHQTRVLSELARAMGPSTGRAAVLPTGEWSSPLFASLVNGASAHVVEQDDVHNGSVVHPGATVLPAALATAQDLQCSGQDLVLAMVVGYEVAIRVGRFLGTSHYRVFHTSGTAGTVGAALSSAKLLGLDEAGMRNALGNAGTQAAGLWEFLRDAADSKQLHTGKAGADGIVAAYGARMGLKGAHQILEGAQGMAAGMSDNPNPRALSRGLGRDWAILETSVKFHASCRHTHPTADALLSVLTENHIDWHHIASVRARVHQAAVDVLKPAQAAATVHQAKFSMPFVLALIAVRGRASIADFHEQSLSDPAIRAFMKRVDMVFDPEVEEQYPERWIGRVEVVGDDGHQFEGRADYPLGDPENFLSHEQLIDKFRRLAAFGGFTDTEGIEKLVHDLENITDIANVRALDLPHPPTRLVIS